MSVTLEPPVIEQFPREMKAEQEIPEKLYICFGWHTKHECAMIRTTVLPHTDLQDTRFTFLTTEAEAIRYAQEHTDSGFVWNGEPPTQMTIPEIYQRAVLAAMMSKCMAELRICKYLDSEWVVLKVLQEKTP